MNNGTVLVTGGAGFIAKYTIKELLANDYSVVVVDINENTEKLPYKYYEIDVAEKELCRVFEENKIDYIIHLAALVSVADSIKMPLEDCRNNYQATVNLCTIAQKYDVKKIVFSSTAAVYADPQYLPVDEKHPVSALSPYAITKYASEQFVKYCGIDYIIFRYANVYGPGQKCFGEAGVIPKFLDLMKHNKPIQIHGSGKQYRDFVYVEDVAKANLLALQTDIQDEIINVSTNRRTSINDLVKIMRSELNYDVEPEYLNTRVGDIEKSVLSNEKLSSLFYYVPQVDIHTGIKKMVHGS